KGKLCNRVLRIAPGVVSASGGGGGFGLVEGREEVFEGLLILAVDSERGARTIRGIIGSRCFAMLGGFGMNHQRIVSDPKIMFGKPVGKGTRITVELILRKLAEGMTDKQILEHHPQLTVHDIRAAAAFAADHLANEEIVVAPSDSR